MKNIIRLLVLLVVLLTTGHSEAAKETLTVNWSPNIYVLGNPEAKLWLDNGARDEITAAITRKLHALRDAGELPFELNEGSTDRDFQQQALGPVLSLVPMAVIGTSVDTMYFDDVNARTLHKSVVLGGISLFVCCVDEEVREVNGRQETVLAYKALGMLPLYSYSILGSDLQNPLLRPATEQEKAAEYTRKLIAAVNGGLDFKSHKNIVKNLSTKQMFSDELYQVAGVDINARQALALFSDKDKANELKGAIGYFYTGAYQQRTKRLMMPPITGNVAVHDDVVNNAYSFSLDSPSGSIDLSMTKPKHTFRLDFYGAANAMLPQSRKDPRGGLVRYKMYQVWLRKNPPEGGEKADMTTKELKIMPAADSSAIQRDDRDIYMEMIVALAQQMGSQKK